MWITQMLPHDVAFLICVPKGEIKETRRAQASKLTYRRRGEGSVEVDRVLAD